MNANEQKHATSTYGAWIGGLVLLAVGGLLLAQQLGAQVPGSLWGCLLIIPGLAAAIASYHRSRIAGLTPAVISQAVLAFFFFALAAATITGIDLALLWPILLIGLAVSLIARSITRRV